MNQIRLNQVKLSRPYLETLVSLSVYHWYPNGSFDQILEFSGLVLDAGGKPKWLEKKFTEASLDCKPSPHKSQDQGWNTALIGAKRGEILCANLLQLNYK